jgi:small-conductance mechanosensitive channel
MSFSQVNNGLDYVLYAVTGFALVWLMISFLLYVRQKIQEPRSLSSAQFPAEPVEAVETAKAIAHLVKQNHDLKCQMLRLAQQVEELQARIENFQTSVKKMWQGAKATTQETHQDLNESDQKLDVIKALPQNGLEQDSLMQQVIELHRDGSMSNRAIAKSLRADRNKVNGIVREYKQSLRSEGVETERRIL